VDVEEADVHIALGLVYIKKSLIEEKIKSGKRFYYAAQQCFERAVNAGGNSSFLFFQLGWACYQNIPPFDKAEAAYLEAIELDSGWGEGTSKADAYYNLAIISLNRGRKNEARERFEKVLKLDPGNKRAKLYIDGLKKE
jgi:tetratricopeptide (TPR) repeat protein